MPKFFYKARKGPSKLEQGVIEAETEFSAINKLIQRGYAPFAVFPEPETAKKKAAPVNRFKKIRQPSLLVFTRQLSNLLESGVTLFKALTILHQQTEDKHLQKIIQEISILVKEGKSFSQSLKQYPQAFSNMYASMVRVGELSGSLEKVLKHLADFGEKQQDFMAKVKTAMAYPILMAVVGIATIAILLTFVIPKLAGLFEDMGQILPLPTRILIATSDFILNFWWLILALGAFFFFAIKRNFFTAKRKLRLDHFKLNLPIFGKFFKQVQIANFSRTLGTLLANDVPILQAINSVSQTLEAETLKQELERITKEIREGSTLAREIAKSKHFPALVANMTTIGEESGRLEDALLKVAEAYERETDQSIKLLTSLIEPVMILVMGVVIGLIIISMMLPIFQINLSGG